MKDSYAYDGLSTSEWINESNFTLNGQHPKAYPFSYDSSKKIYFEGMVYSTNAQDLIKSITHKLNAGNLGAIAEELRGVDGEFVIILQSEGKIWIINDSWGRLPIYYSDKNEGFLFSRNISFLTNTLSPGFDKLQLAIQLILGMNLGTSTHWNNIMRLPPNAIVEIDTENNTFDIHEFFHVPVVSGNAELSSTANEISKELVIALQNRLDKLNNPTLSLSGGLDSRLTVAALAEIGEHIPLITYFRTEGQDVLDDSSSRKIAAQINRTKDHELVELPKHTFNDTLELIQHKQGMNCASMGYVIPYHKMHEERNISSIADDGGGKFFRDLYPFYDLKSIDDLIDYIIKKHGACSIAYAAEICKVSKDELRSYLSEYFNSYPADSFNDKYAYFSVRDIGINWAYEGGDRNRHYCWITTPFYSPKVIELCLSLPQREKAHGRLFNLLYKSYPGNLESILNPNWKQGVDNEEQIEKLFNRQRIKSRIPKSILDLKNNIGIDAFYFSDELKTEIQHHQGELQLGKMKKKNSDNFYWQLLTILLVLRDKK
jgi:asparagine synthase (glutamine-hydrolysing)